MSSYEKNTRLQHTQTHIQEIAERLTHKRATLLDSIHDLRRALKRPSLDSIAQRKLVQILEEQQEQLRELSFSPYFHRCDLQFESDTPLETFYIAKFSVPDEQLVSWVAPVARLRFATPGPCSYPRPDGSTRRGQLLRKDQYLIVDRNLLFFATEELHQARELIYQEHFTQHKTEFALPEIVAQMEKAQDDVLRIPYQGSLHISGPAGSGKTTLALHRVAFLSQSPDTAPLFPHRRMIVFVQDRSTQAYFSHLLPTLGIHDVRITTFEDWALDHLNIEGYTVQMRIGDTEEARNQYEYEKNHILQEALPNPRSWPADSTELLERIYSQRLSSTTRSLWKQQRQRKILDRFDVTLLLLLQKQKGGHLSTSRTVKTRQKNGTWKEKTLYEGYAYALMVLDEVQNYLPIQVQLLKSCVDPKTQAMMYIGDLAQQTRIGGLKRWEDIGELFSSERAIVLQKGYRQTQQLLEYIRSRGYTVQIPPEPKQGPAVQEHLVTSPNEREHLVNQLLSSLSSDRTIGVLASAPEDLLPYQPTLARLPHIRCMTIHEAQGVEFDTVILLESPPLTHADQVPSLNFQKELEHIQRDLLYVGLTRAMYAMHVIKITS